MIPSQLRNSNEIIAVFINTKIFKKVDLFKIFKEMYLSVYVNLFIITSVL